MEIKSIKLSRLTENGANPRKISDKNLDKLINSILVFPKMLEIRPIVINDTYTPLGGNMRIKALNRIASMEYEDIVKRLESIYNFTKKTKKKKDELLNYWNGWLTKKTVPVVVASSLSESERSQFIIKDNISFGQWNMEQLKNWDNDALSDWGVSIKLSLSEPVQDSGQEAEEIIPEEALPEELRGIDMTPQDLPKLQGDGETKNEYLSISYTDEYADILADIAGIPADKLFSKIVWSIDELIKIKHK